MWFTHTAVRFLFTIKMSCKKLLHVKYCGEAAADFGTSQVSKAL